MADALISVVLDQLASYAQNELTLMVDTHQEVLNLTDTLIQVQAVLADADEKQIKNNSVRIWLDNLKQVVYDADDVLDEWRTRVAISQIQSDVNVAAGTHKKVLSYLLSPCFCFQNVIVHYDMGQNIRDINKRLDRIAKQRIDFGLKCVYQSHDEPRRLTSSVVDVSKIHGRDQAKEDLMSRLLGESSCDWMGTRVIAIVGIGGLGKTTLARLIFKEERVNENFKIKMWVCVTDPFNLIGVAKAIIKEARGAVRESAEWEEVHKCLCQSLQGKQFLLVLDDVWTEDPSHWSQLKLALDGGAPGSRIIVTTRNRTVAKIMGTTEFDVHDLEKLSDDASWLVLRDVALVGKEELETFEEIGKEIAIKCKGVPLAITTLASLLCGRQTKQEWKNVLASDLWEMPQIEQFFLPSLFLSYYSLPAISKHCFLYCAMFPKDTKIDKDLLIKLWMGQGFFGFDERKDLERIGEDHFHILAMRSFFQDFEKDSDGNIRSCKMHDLIHDFAMYLSQNESRSLQEGDTISNYDKVRHLYADELEIPYIWNAKNLRTLFFGKGSAVPNELFDKLTCLRTLDLSYNVLKVLPDEVEKLVHLRYLDLSCTKLLELPETICNLYNLQYLGLDKCRNLHKLPEKIGKLSNLRHLDIDGTNALSYFPKTIAALSSLRSLCKFIVSGVGHGCTIGDLQFLNNLRGALLLGGLSRVTNEKDAVQAKLKKKNLRELRFDFKEESDVRIGRKNILEKLEPHQDLEIIEISDYSDSLFPGWVQSCALLTNIVEMRLYRCNQCTELPAFGKLAFLKTLKIKGMGSVKHIGHEFYGFGAQMTAFPKLNSLVIEDMEKLEEWEVLISKDTKIMPLLVEIELENFPMLRALPCLGSLKSLGKLRLEKLSSVKYIGNEFYGFGADSSLGVKMIAFPKLKTLTVSNFHELEEWEIPISKDRKIMPFLSQMILRFCRKLRSLPHVWKMKSLEVLYLLFLESVERVGAEFLGVVDDNGGTLQDGVIFPELRELSISCMDGLEEWSVPFITPCLTRLRLSDFPKLKTLPTFSCMKPLKSLEILVMYEWEGQEKILINQKEGSGGDLCVHRLDIGPCPKLRVVPDYMFSPSLKVLYLRDDVGNLYNSFPTDNTLCSVFNVYISNIPHSWLPKGFNQLKALQSVVFGRCKTLDFDLKELGHFTMLQHLEIRNCPVLKERFEGDDWRTTLAHVPRIYIDRGEITNKG